MMATYVFSTDFYIGAESEEQARDGLLELLNEIVGRDDSSPFDLIEMIYEETADAELV
jgi:chorismate mutase